METKTSNYLVPIDFTPASGSATKFAMELAQDDHDKIILLHVISNERDRLEAQQKMGVFLQNYHIDDSKIQAKIVQGSLTDEIEEVAKIMDVDLIILGTHCITGLGKLFRSHAFKIVENVSVPLIIVQNETSFQKINKIVMTIDLERESVQIVRMAANISKMFDSEIILVTKEIHDPELKHKVAVNLQVCNKVLTEKNIPHKVVFVDGKDFIGNIFKLCQEEGADLLAATYYQQHVHIFTESFVQTLAYNDLHIPLLTMDEESTHSGTQFGAMWG